MIPAMGQAALGIECINDSKVKELISVLNDEESMIETTIEREFVKELEGGCQVPIGINAKIEGQSIKVNAIIGMPDGSKMLKESIEVDDSEFLEAGKKLAESFIKQGAKELLKSAEKCALEEIL
jgi:hydroxymethylbilane synthase